MYVDFTLLLLRRHTFLLVQESMQRMTRGQAPRPLRLRHDAMGCSHRITRRIPNGFTAVETTRGGNGVAMQCLAEVNNIENKTMTADDLQIIMAAA